jgi:hypothetical protein
MRAEYQKAQPALRGSVLALRAAAEPGPEVSQSQTEAGEDHEEQDRVADAHVQWHLCGERFSALATMEQTQSAGARTLPPGIANTSKSNFEPARCQPFAARAATDSNIAFIPFSSPSLPLQHMPLQHMPLQHMPGQLSTPKKS